MDVLITTAVLLSFASPLPSGPVRTAGPHRNFYLEEGGSDSNDGLSKGHAWKTLGRVAQEKLGPGDSVWLGSGETFPGNLGLNPGSKGTPESPIVIGSRGKPATILAETGSAITISAPGIHVLNLRLKGGFHGEAEDKKTKKEEKPGLSLMATGPESFRGNVVDRVEISGFGGDGLSIQAAKKNPNGFDGLRVTAVLAHDNEGAGISSGDDFAYLGKPGAHQNLLISDCETDHNYGGSGIVLSGIRSGLVQYCRSAGSAGDGGGVGIWAWAAQHLTFRYCISSGTRSGGGDGGGFDLDGATEFCTVERCLSYDNDGPGYMHCDYPTAPFTRNNVITKSVSVNDGVKKKGDSLGFGFVTWGSGLDDCTISGNRAYVSRPDPAKRDFGVLFVSYILGSLGPKDVPHVRGCRFEGNRVEISGQGYASVRNELEHSGPTDIVFSGNTFVVGSDLRFVDGGKKPSTFTDLKSWAKAAGQPVDKNRVEAHADAASVPSDYRSVKPRDLPAWISGALSL